MTRARAANRLALAPSTYRAPSPFTARIPCSIPGVAVLATDLDAMDPDLSVLSIDEAERAGRYRRRSDRDRFVASRCWVRRLLSDQALCAPAEIRFRYGPRGKPEIAWPSSAPRFSLAHSGPLALLAVSARFRVGIDVEQLGSRFDPAAAALVMSPVEMAFIASRSDPDRSFIECWTRKEAYAKLDGWGLEHELVKLTLSGPSARYGTFGFTIIDLEIEGAVGAIAVSDSPSRQSESPNLGARS